MRSLLVVSLVMVTCAVGCASRPGSEAAIVDPHSGVPDDFSLDLAIMAGRDAPERDPVHQRPGRFILFPDGSLHYADDPEQFGMRWRPSKMRLLTREQMAHIWSLVQAEHLGDPAVADPLVNIFSIQPQREEMLYVLAVTAGDERWIFEQTADASDAESSIARLVRALAALAWATDIDTSETRIIPKRYDFGPDPYAQYRR